MFSRLSHVQGPEENHAHRIDRLQKPPKYLLLANTIGSDTATLQQSIHAVLVALATDHCTLCVKEWLAVSSTGLAPARRMAWKGVAESYPKEAQLKSLSLSSDKTGIS